MTTELNIIINSVSVVITAILIFTINSQKSALKEMIIAQAVSFEKMIAQLASEIREIRNCQKDFVPKELCEILRSSISQTDEQLLKNINGLGHKVEKNNEKMDIRVTELERGIS